MRNCIVVSAVAYMITRQAGGDFDRVAMQWVSSYSTNCKGLTIAPNREGNQVLHQGALLFKRASGVNDVEICKCTNSTTFSNLMNFQRVS